MKSLKLVSFIITFSFVIGCSNQIDFNSSKWKNWTESDNSPGLRWKMCKNLLEKHELKTYNKQQIVDLLGKPNSKIDNKYRYFLGYTESGINTGTMVIIFINDVVSNIKIIEG